MLKIAFVCLGNICRSPMAEAVFKHLLDERGLSDRVTVDSFGVSDEEEGNGIYPLALKTLESHGITAKHTAKKITATDVAEFDYVMVMELRHRGTILCMTRGEYADRVKPLCKDRDIVDPWYTRDFEKSYADIKACCMSLLDELIAQGKI